MDNFWKLIRDKILYGGRKKADKAVDEASFWDMKNVDIYRHKKRDIPREGLETDWKTEYRKEEKKESYEVHPLLIRILWISLSFFLIALFIVLYTFRVGKNRVADELIGVEITARSFVSSGQEFPVNILVRNENSSDIKDVEVYLSYVDDVSGKTIKTKTNEIGDIPSGGFNQVVIPMSVFGALGKAEEIAVNLVYGIPNSNAMFSKVETFDIEIKSSSMNIYVDGSEIATEGQKYDFEVKVKNVSDKEQKDILITFDFPSNFELIEASLPQYTDNETYLLGDFKKGEEKSIVMEGVFDNEFDAVAIDMVVGIRGGDDIATVLQAYSHSVFVENKFMSVTPSVNGAVAGGDFVVIYPGDVVNVDLTCVNNADYKILNPRIEVLLDGNGIDWDSVKLNKGTYDKNSKKIIYSPSDIVLSGAGALNPSESCSLGFTFKTLSGALSNPTVKFSVNAYGVDAFGFANKLENVSVVEMRMSSAVSFVATGLYGGGRFENTGPVPPVEGKETTYSIFMELKNTSNDVQDVKVVGVLPDYVDFAGKKYSSDGTIEYDESSKTITWNLGVLRRGAGVFGKSSEAEFQIVVNPPTSFAGSPMTLFKDIKMSGQDSYTEFYYDIKAKNVTTNISGLPGGGRVVAGS